jgi:tRNA-dihydrouridine synthase
MLGFTEYHFRNTYSRHFSGIDAAVLPFVTLVEGRNVKVAHIKDVWKENNRSAFRLVPQVLGNDGDMFVSMSRRLAEMGYDEVNWNLGCPVPRVVSHKRGSGLLPYPEQIDKVLDTVFQYATIAISVKLRLGYKSADDILKIIPILNRYPLKSICLHPRIGTQMYEGKADFELFRQLLPEFRHAMIYNGDIFSASDFDIRKKQCPQVKQWMLGRGIFWDPFLPEKIKGTYQETPCTAKKRFEEFHKDLFEAVLQRSVLERNAMNKMKEYWKYYCLLYEDALAIFDKIKMCRNLIEIADVFCFIYGKCRLLSN